MKLLLLSSSVILCAASCAHAEFIGVSWFGPIYRINEQSGTANIIGNGVSGMNSLAGPFQGKLYTIASDQLVTLDAHTGAVLDTKQLSIADFPSSSFFGSSAFSPTGELFAGHSIQSPPGYKTRLSKIDVGTGVVTALGTLPLGVGAMTFSPEGTLYAWDIGESGNGNGFGLVTLKTDGSGFTDVNPLVGTPRADIQAIEFSPSGVLYGARNQLFTIDLSSGQWTAVGPRFNGDVRGLAFVPEPSSVVLGVIALAALYTRRRKFVAHNRV